MSDPTDPNQEHDLGAQARDEQSTPGSDWRWRGPWSTSPGQDEPTLTDEPTAQGHTTPPSVFAPSPSEKPPAGAPGSWPPPSGPSSSQLYAPPYPPAPTHSAGPGGTPGGAPPYGPPPNGYGYGYGSSPWGQPSWHGGAQWHWPAHPQQQTTPGRSATAIFTTAVAAVVAVAAILGVVVGHALWKNSSTSAGSPSAGSPFGIGGTTPTTSGPGSGYSAAGGPGDAGSIAQKVDPALVDVNTDINYGEVEGAGTGMVLTSTGEILTNNHVIEGATTIRVTDIGNGKTYGATVVGYDRSQDVAVLQLTNASGLQTVTIGNSSTVTTGQGVVVIGNANGVGGTPSYSGGSVTATNQSISASDEITNSEEQLSGLIETNADIISGDSGGPMVNTSGQVVGMDTASSGSSGGFEFQAPANQGYAIPINEAIDAAKKMEAGDTSSVIHIGPTAFLGVEVADASSGCGGGFGGIGGIGGSTSSGALICDVVSGGPADQAGLAGGDTITAVDGHSVGSESDLTDVMVEYEKPNTSVVVQYVDQTGQNQSVNVTLGSGPPQ